MLRSTLLKLSDSKGFANWVTSNGTTRRMARRFVAGETLDEAIAAARGCNNAGMLASLDYLGENVATISDAQHSRDAYLEVFERIAQEGLHANVSGKLSQLGLDINIEFCEGLLRSIVERAASFDNFLRIDMEGSLYTQRTIDLVKRVPAQSRCGCQFRPPDAAPAIQRLLPRYRHARAAHDRCDHSSCGSQADFQG